MPTARMILSGEKNSGALIGEFLDDLPHVVASFGIEPRGRLVEENHLRLPDPLGPPQFR